MTIEFFMFEEISVIVPFSLVKERFVSSIHFNLKNECTVLSSTIAFLKDIVLYFCIEGV